MKTKLAIIGSAVFLTISACGVVEVEDTESQPEPQPTASKSTSDKKPDDPIPGLIMERWGACFDGLTADKIEKLGRTTYSAELPTTGLLLWKISESNTGETMTLPDEDTLYFAEQSGCLD